MNSSSFEIAPNEKEDHEPLISEINIRKVAAEFIGTYILIFIGVGSILVDQRVQITLLGVALAWGTVVTALVYTIGHISGCHLNPAITIAFATIHQFPWKMVIPYAVSQVLSATLACLTLLCLFAGEHATSVMQSHPIGSTSNLSAVASEIMVTFILMFVTCGSVTDDMAAKDLAGVAIGATVTFNVVIAGTFSGPSMNPARSLGSAIATMNFRGIWVYIIAPVTGAVAGSFAYHFVRLPELKKNNTMALKT